MFFGRFGDIFPLRERCRVLHTKGRSKEHPGMFFWLPRTFLERFGQELFLVPLIGGRWCIITQMAVYTTYSPCQLGDYMLPIPPIKETRFHSIEFGLINHFPTFSLQSSNLMFFTRFHSSTALEPLGPLGGLGLELRKHVAYIARKTSLNKNLPEKKRGRGKQAPGKQVATLISINLKPPTKPGHSSCL